MSANRNDPGRVLLRRWRRLSRWPGGGWLFSRLVGWTAPYSGTTGANVRTLEPGRAVLVMRDHRRIRNHLDSIHAVALANAGELASGLAMLTALPEETRSIVVGLSCRYEKKARGRVTVTGRAAPPEAVPEAIEAVARAAMHDEGGDRVARLEVTWRLSPRQT